MITIKYDLFSIIGEDNCSDLIKLIYDRAKDIATVFETIEFNIIETRDLLYRIVISEKQRDIFLKNIDTLIEIYLRIKEEVITPGDIRFYSYGMLLSRDLWQNGCKMHACNDVFYFIFDVFNAIEAKNPIIYFSGKALDELNIIIKGYLKYFGKEDELTAALQRLENDGSNKYFQCEEDIICSSGIGKDIVFPKGLLLPSTVKFEVRQEIDGVFYATVSEETAFEFTKYRKELVKLARDNYHSHTSGMNYYSVLIQPVFFPRLWREFGYSYIHNVIREIAALTMGIIKLSKLPDPQNICITRRHLEEIHMIAQECLEIDLFGIKGDIKDSAQLAQLIDTHFKTLDPPTGSKTKPAIRETL